MNRRRNIGIDLGTTRCCVASVEERNMPKTILNELGRPTTPSYVYFENDNVYVGDTAINSPNPGKNLIYDAKRLIGRQFDDGHVINDKQTLSYDVVREPNEPNRGKAMINIERNGRKERISPEDVAAELLKKMKQYAEDHFGGDEVQGAVIAVPAYFNIRQRSATMEAARLAGLNVLRLVTEPTAAAIALYIKLRDQAKTVLIYDLGGGGEDFDELIALDFINQFQAMYQARFPNDSNTRRKLRSRCREVKENMSNTIGDQTVEMPVVVGNKTYNLNYTINQRRFHEMLEPQILGTMAIVEDALNNAGLGPEDINNILLVGGSTRIPLIKTLLQQRFGSSKILQNIHPDEAIAIGAAILASQSYPEYNSPEPAPVPKCAIGIDLGTTRCCVAIVDGTGKVQTIPNDLGNTITPSWILYSHGEVKVGSAAINAPSTGKNLIYDSKRLIGRQFNDECVIRDRAGWSFEVVRGNVSDEKGKAMIKITEEHPDGIKDQLIAPEEASGELLKAMKQYAELHLGGQKVTDAVITVPAYFDMRQREATERAAQHAGLTNVRLLTEPTAAAIALAMKKRETNRTILIYDLGGGTFDVSIGRITDQKLEILCIGGDTHLGGEDFDELIVKDFIAHFEKKHEVSFPDDKVMRRRLKNQCREVKENIMGIGSDLSIEMTFNIGGENYPLEYKINRTRFNELCESSFRCTMAIIDNALRNAKLSQDQVNDILLVGGSTRIPRIRELIKEKFPRAGILQNVNPDESIAIGAAIYAAQLGRRDRPSPRPKDANAFDANNSINLYDAAYMTLDICEAIPLSIGMELRGGLVKVVIPRGTPYPTTISQVTRTVMDNQPEFRTDIYEGERARTRDNIKIGTILMNGLKPVPRGSLHVTEFHIDHNGILHVTHTEKCSNRKVNFMIAYDGPRRTATDVAHYLRDAERNREADEQFQRVCDLRRTCETYAHNEKGRIAASTTLPAYKLESAQAIIEEYLVWLGEFPEDYEEVQMKFEKFKNSINSIFQS